MRIRKTSLDFFETETQTCFSVFLDAVLKIDEKAENFFKETDEILKKCKRFPMKILLKTIPIGVLWCRLEKRRG